MGELEVANANTTAANLNHEEGEEGKAGDSSSEVTELCAIKVLDLEHVDTNFSGE